MSETETAAQGGADAAEPVVIEADAPGTEGAAPEPTPEQVEADKAERESRADRRIGRLTARLSAGEAERARMAAEIDAMRRAANPEAERPIAPEDIPRLVEQQVAAEVARRAVVERVQTFHEAGRAAYPDWNERCQNLMAMGADPAFAELLVETPDGAKVAAALSDDPEEMERIAALKTERARAIALGRYAATLEARPVTPPRTSRAPAPIRPLGGSARAEFDPTRATTEQLVEHYSREAMARRGVR